MVEMKLVEAYETLEDSVKSHSYDIRWPGINAKERAEHDAEKRRKEAAEASRRQAAQEAAKKKKVNDERQARLDYWIAERNRYQDDIFEGNRRVTRLKSEIAHVQSLDDNELKKEKAKNSWWTFFSSPVYGKVKEREDEKRDREVKRLDRNATKRIKKN
jgi:hypothetical protein